jgi:hypothetical protein
MFDFEEWSEKVLAVTGSLELPRSGVNTSVYQAQLMRLWKEMMEQENDEFIEFLRVLLNKMKEHVQGQLDEPTFLQMAEQLRVKMLQDT